MKHPRTETRPWFRLCAFLWCCCCWASGSPAWAQSSADSTGTQTSLYRFDFRETPLDEAIQRLLAASRIELVYDPALTAGKETTCVVRNVRLEDVFRCLLADTGLTFERLSSGVYLIKKAVPKTSQVEQPILGAPAQKYTISGFAMDAQTGEKLIGANLYVPDRGVGTATNTYGFFSLTLPTDSVTLVVSYLGYEPVMYRLLLDSDLRLPIHLQPATLNAEGIEVVGERIESLEEQTRMSTIGIPIQQIRALPALLGEVDVLRTLQLLPGVQSGTDGTSGLFVRGGSPDQNLLLLDGAQVYNASHLFGFFSVFNSDAIKHVSLIKGGFPARYGGRLSSVVDIGLKEGNMKRFAAQGSIGIVASRLLVEGPIVKDKTSFIVSGRRTYIDVLTRPFMSAKNQQGYHFYDLNAKINHTLSSNDRIHFSIYGGNDRYFSNEKYDNSRSEGFLRWGNITSTLRWNHLVNDKLFSNVTATFSRYRFNIGTKDTEFITNQVLEYFYVSSIRDWGLKADFDYVPAPSHYIRFGASGTYHTLRPGATQVNSDLSDAGPLPLILEPTGALNAVEYALYAEDDFKVSPRLKVNAGVHASGFLINHRHFTSIQPRISLRYMFLEGWAAKASYASMKQYILLLSNSSVGLPTDLWLPATARVPPQSSELFAAGLAHTIKQAYEFSLEAYYKRMDHLIEYKNGANFLGLDKDWQDKVESGRGWAYGVEVFLQKKTGRTTGWLGYTLAWSNRRFDNLNGGRTFPFKYDRRHDFSLVLIHQFTPSIEFSGSWSYASGSAITLPNAVYYSAFPFVRSLIGGLRANGDCEYRCAIESYGARNDYRLRAYHRLDVGVNFHKRRQDRERTISIGLYNAYNRKNPFFLIDEGDGFKQFSLFPILPYITYRRTF